MRLKNNQHLKLESSQDGGIGGFDIHFVPQNCNYNWNDSHKACTESYQRIWTAKRTQKSTGYLGRMKEWKRWKRKEKGWDIPLWGSWRRGEVITSGEVPSLVAKYTKIEGGDDLYYSPICPSLRQVSSSAGGDWMQKSRVRRAGLQRGLLLAEWRWPKRVGERRSIARNAPGRSVDCLGSEAPLLSHA